MGERVVCVAGVSVEAAVAWCLGRGSRRWLAGVQRVEGVAERRGALIMRRVFVWSLALVGFVALGLATAGCARRFDLSAAELARVAADDPALERLRVHVDRRLLVVYEPAEVVGSYAVDGAVIRERSDRRSLRQIVGTGAAGAVVGRTEAGGMPVLWVSFDAACRDPGCALGFVLDEAGRHVLFAVPPAAGMEARVHDRRGRPRRELTLRRVRSLADANAVYARELRGRVITVGLEVRKSVRRRERTEVRRAPGFGERAR